MLGWIIGMIAVTAITIVTLDLLGNDEIFNGDLEDGIGTGGIFPYDSIEALSCETEVQFTDIDKARSILAVQEIWIYWEKIRLDPLLEWMLKPG